jgi:hypothetical protein
VCEGSGREASDGVSVSSSSSSQGMSSSSPLSGVGVWMGRVADEGSTGVTSPLEGTFRVGVSIGRAMLGLFPGNSGTAVGVASDEHGVLGYTDGLGTPGLGVNAGALLGLNDSGT